MFLFFALQFIENPSIDLQDDISNIVCSQNNEEAAEIEKTISSIIIGTNPPPAEPSSAVLPVETPQEERMYKEMFEL